MNLLIPAVTSTQPLSIFQNQERRVFFDDCLFMQWAPYILSFQFLFAGASLHFTKGSGQFLLWVESTFFSRMAPGLDKLMWLLTINITHLFQKMSSFVSEIDTKIFCRIIFRQNDAHFFVHNWKKRSGREAKTHATETIFFDWQMCT